jgi:hypothetical protein
LGYFSEADDACRFAIEYGKAEIDGRKRPHVTKRTTAMEPAVTSERARNA